jgi:hypothetical protein
MRAFEFLLTESEGGMMRRAEEAQRGKRVAFKNAAGNVITILDTEVFPQDGDKADDYNQLATELLDYLKQQGVAANNTFTLPPGSGLTAPEKSGAALAMIFQEEKTNKKIAWIALKPTKKTGAYPFFMQTKLFSDLTGYAQLSGKKGEEDKISGVQQRASTNLKPVGIIPTNRAIDVDNIPQEVESFIKGRNDLSPEIKEQVVRLLEEVAAGSSNPVPGAGEYAKSYEIDLGETAAPIALIKKKFLSGDWRAVEEGMGIDFGSIRKVEFPNDPVEKLYDSYLIIDKNTKVRVSSKDKSGGAKASVSGVVDDITNYPERFEGLFDPRTNPGFDDMLDIVKIIKSPDMSIVSNSKRFKRNGSIAGALQLGIKMGVITSQQSSRIVDIIESDTQKLSDEDLGDLKTILSYKGTDDANRPDYRIGWHLLAGVAAESANRVNKNYKTDAFFKKVLERSNMLQVKTTLKQAATKDEEGNATQGAYFSNFQVIYPPVFTGTIKLDASTNFFATRRPVGKMGFSIK